ncbi:hypothetical protein A9267_00150 [Shewanella sp. UCD-FRSSP16_17]|uniref:hypothetical protein n=1 Tax=unclassified Shewanella TaxID=196818 RepID=UPI0007EEE05B|nr:MULTISPECIES: hypothetical protein [unclassified Shewanella]MBQ4889233.1 hypothetical protein [Shewanella sp. MMG014]OBT11101.1 hypothetical protein A9267_00150 [Shewanella sp. UCD-FRSSP16_17]
MDDSAKLEFASLITDQTKLLELIAQVPHQALKQYPALQKHLVIQSERNKELQRAIKNGDFTEQEWNLSLYRLLDNLGYEMVQTIDTTILSNRVIHLVGADIHSIETLSIQDIGSEVLSEILIKMANSVIDTTKVKVIKYPWLAEKGRIDFGFYAQLDKVYAAWVDGFTSHYKLNMWCESNIGTRAPQSCIKFFKEHGNPSEIKEWLEWKSTR